MLGGPFMIYFSVSTANGYLCRRALGFPCVRHHGKDRTAASDVGVSRLARHQIRGFTLVATFNCSLLFIPLPAQRQCGRVRKIVRCPSG